MDVPICVVKNNTFDGFMAVGYGIHEVVGWCETWISDGLVLKLDSIRKLFAFGGLGVGFMDSVVFWGCVEIPPIYAMVSP